MRYGSVRKLWNKVIGAPVSRPHAGEDSPDAALGLALSRLRAEPVRVRSWEHIEKLILTTDKEHVMTPISRGTILGLSRKAALIGAAGTAILLAFFTVPFSQSNPVGAKIVFEFTPPLADGALVQSLRNCASSKADLLPDKRDYGITNCNLCLKMTEDGLSRLEFLVLTETGIVPDDLVRDLTSRYPELAQAQTAIIPIEEQAQGSLFENLVGATKISLHCEGMTVEEIEAQVKAQMAAQGMPDAEVHVDKEGDSSRVRIRVCVKDTTGQR